MDKNACHQHEIPSRPYQLASLHLDVMERKKLTFLETGEDKMRLNDEVSTFLACDVIRCFYTKLHVRSGMPQWYYSPDARHVGMANPGWHTYQKEGPGGK